MTKDKTDKATEKNPVADPDAWMDNMTKIGAQSMQFWSQYWPNMMQQGLSGNPDPFGMQDIFQKMTNEAMADPNKMVDLSKNYMEQYFELCSRYMSGQYADEEPNKSDRRFKNDSWDSHPGFRFVKDAYLMTADWLQDLPEHAGGLDGHEKQKLDFFVKQYADAMSPANFLLTNPDVMQETLETNGANLAQGMENFMKDLEAGNGRLKVSMVPENSFELGKNIALSEGDVVYRNDLIELICYTPQTETVSKTPLMIVPPWINKYYILDLQPKNSFIQWAVNQGQQVYVLSWANPEEKHADMGFAEYMKLGPLAAIDVIKQRTGEEQVNAIGYCLGGTLLATTLAYLAEQDRADEIKSATFFTTLVDFSDPGELGVFIDEGQISALEEKMKDQGFMDGADMAMSFNLLRANDLIWSFVVNNYLMGKEPFPFDLLYWNSDSTRLPCKMHSWYLRKLYMENKLVEPGALDIDGVPIDLSKIKTPVFILCTHDDHIAPWKSCFKATGLYSGPIKFVLAGSGHIAGVINPPQERIKYGFWENNRRYKYPDKWLDAAKYTEGSWWPTWKDWLSKYAGDEIEISLLPSAEKDSLAKAPGTYVLKK